MLSRWQDARHALFQARQRAPRVVGWRPGGWVVYKATEPPSGVTPELLVLSRTAPPIPLSDEGSVVLASILRAIHETA